MKIRKVETPNDYIRIHDPIMDEYMTDLMGKANYDGDMEDGLWVYDHSKKLNENDINLDKLHYVEEIIYYPEEHKFEVYSNRKELYKIIVSKEYNITI